MTKNMHESTKTKQKRLKSTKIQSWIPQKESLSHNFIEDEDNFRKISIQQGDIYYCEIGENVGEETCNNRPVLIVSKSFYNHHSSQVTILPLSETVNTKVVYKHGKKKTVMKTRTHYLLRKTDFQFLNADSAVKCEQIRSVSKARLNYKIGSIDDESLKRIQTRIKSLLDI